MNANNDPDQIPCVRKLDYCDHSCGERIGCHGDAFDFSRFVAVRINISSLLQR